MCNEGADAGYIFCGPERDGFGDAVRLVKDAGHTVVIITDRAFGTTPEVSQGHTRNWLDQHRVPYDELIFSADKTIVPTDFFVEDKVSNFLALEAAGTEVYLVNRAWNQDLDTNRRIDSVMDYARIVLQKSLQSC